MNVSFSGLDVTVNVSRHRINPIIVIVKPSYVIKIICLDLVLAQARVLLRLVYCVRVK